MKKNGRFSFINMRTSLFFGVLILVKYLHLDNKREKKLKFYSSFISIKIGSLHFKSLKFNKILFFSSKLLDARIKNSERNEAQNSNESEKELNGKIESFANYNDLLIFCMRFCIKQDLMRLLEILFCFLFIPISVHFWDIQVLDLLGQIFFRIL